MCCASCSATAEAPPTSPEFHPGLNFEQGCADIVRAHVGLRARSSRNSTAGSAGGRDELFESLCRSRP
jgi:hypothetical protein